MTSMRTLLVALGAAATLTLGGQTVAHAEPAPPLPVPISGLQAPGLPAVQSLAPAIQQAAADPSNAASMLMAAAAVFAGDAAAPADSRNVAAAVNQFVADPQVAHIPAAGAIPGTEAHLPAGVNPARVVGPLPPARCHRWSRHQSSRHRRQHLPRHRMPYLHQHPMRRPPLRWQARRPAVPPLRCRHPVRRLTSDRTRPSRRTSCTRRSAAGA